ncbi:hypothetical protein [uncultured Parasutterella sp.]|uniref:hypothetical protein n=1 Tax=uncultured Parasutterella sp. TaxID=1263098 RepID=UPI0025B296F7|nr:hypothetical protein [uncultured Parasutterella sp.]
MNVTTGAGSASIERRATYRAGGAAPSISAALTALISILVLCMFTGPKNAKKDAPEFVPGRPYFCLASVPEI